MAKRVTKPRQNRVRISCQAGSAKSVFLAGTFNDWDALRTPMMRDSNGEWYVDIPLPAGRHEYKFIIDGQWCCDPEKPDEYCETPDCVCNEHGTMNRVVEVS